MDFSRRDALLAGGAFALTPLAGCATAAAPPMIPRAAPPPAYFETLPAQPPMNLVSEAYSAAALEMSRYAAFTTRHEFDVAYGADPAQKLDIYLPADTGACDMPVFLNIHGGGWTNGYKEWLGLSAPVVTAFPAIYISTNYRLAPESKHPAQLNDCLAALGWIHANIARYGGDPNRIHIGGHSAGAQLSALIALRHDLYAAHGLPSDVVKSCFPYCGIYDLRASKGAKGPADAMLSDAKAAADASPLLFAGRAKISTPFYITWGEDDGGPMKKDGPVFAAALKKAGVRAETLVFPLFDHFFMNLDQARPDNAWSRTLRNWMLGDPHTAEAITAV